MDKKICFYETKIGIMKITYNIKIEKIELVDKIEEKNSKTELTDMLILELREYLAGKRRHFDIYDYIKLSGTDFQKIVWNELIKIPYGQTRTYKDIAQSINHPKAVRAVANAIGANPHMIIIPCHRVIRSDGSIGGYEYGIKVKNKLLDIEKGAGAK